MLYQNVQEQEGRVIVAPLQRAFGGCVAYFLAFFFLCGKNGSFFFPNGILRGRCGHHYREIHEKEYHRYNTDNVLSLRWLPCGCFVWLLTPLVAPQKNNIKWYVRRRTARCFLHFVVVHFQLLSFYTIPSSSCSPIYLSRFFYDKVTKHERLRIIL